MFCRVPWDVYFVLMHRDKNIFKTLLKPILGEVERFLES